MKIMLDAGHYGKKNKSPALPEYYESLRMWTLCEYLCEFLQCYGFTVLKTREDQATDMPVAARGESAKGCDLFISLHTNAVGNYISDTDRVEVYAPYDNINDSHRLASYLARAVADTMGVSKGIVKTKERKNRNGEYYGVLRGARKAGCKFYYLIEHSFHTNPAATLWLMDDENLKMLAAREASVIATYFGHKKPIIDFDVNSDGVFNALDALLIKRAVLDNLSPEAKESFLTDVNRDGITDVFDYILAKQALLNE
jgi:N-acetylmuramoyl-L-alanine amidase